MEEKKKRYKIIIWGISILVGVIYVLAFYFNWTGLSAAFVMEENLWLLLNHYWFRLKAIIY